MFIQRFSSYGLLPRQILTKIPTNSSYSRMQFPTQSKSFLTVSSTQRLLINPCLWFSSYKKSSKAGQKHTHKIIKTEMKIDENGQRYLVLYDAQKQQNSFRVISILLILIFGLTLVKIYHTDSQDRRDDYIVLLIIAGSFFVYQKRIFNTLKKVTLNSKGDKLLLTTFNSMGKGQKQLSAPIQLMTGYTRATRLGGYVLTAGGNATGFKEAKFWFTKQYITDRPTFDYVSQGKRPKIVDQFTTL